MTDVRWTVIWPPHIPGLGLQVLLPQNVFLLHAQNELLFQDGSTFCCGRKENREWNKSDRSTCYGRWLFPARKVTLPLKRMISISSTRFSLFIPYHLFLSGQCSSRLIYTWVTLVQGSVMCGPGWKCFSTDIKSWIWSRGDFTISRVIFLLYWVLLCSQSNVTCVSYCLAKNKQGRKELDFLDYLQTGFGFLGLPTNWFLQHQWGWQLTLPFQLPVFKYVSDS